MVYIGSQLVPSNMSLSWDKCQCFNILARLIVGNTYCLHRFVCELYASVCGVRVCWSNTPSWRQWWVNVCPWGYRIESILPGCIEEVEFAKFGITLSACCFSCFPSDTMTLWIYSCCASSSIAPLLPSFSTKLQLGLIKNGLSGILSISGGRHIQQLEHTVFSCGLFARINMDISIRGKLPLLERKINMNGIQCCIFLSSLTRTLKVLKNPHLAFDLFLILMFSLQTRWRTLLAMTPWVTVSSLRMALNSVTLSFTTLVCWLDLGLCCPLTAMRPSAPASRTKSTRDTLPHPAQSASKRTE